MENRVHRGVNADDDSQTRNFLTSAVNYWDTGNPFTSSNWRWRVAGAEFCRRGGKRGDFLAVFKSKGRGRMYMHCDGKHNIVVCEAKV